MWFGDGLFSFLGGSRGGSMGNIFFALSWANSRDQSVQQSRQKYGIRLGGELINNLGNSPGDGRHTVYISMTQPRYNFSGSYQLISILVSVIVGITLKTDLFCVCKQDR